MIHGIGTDILNSHRVKKLINKYNKKFLNRYFGVNEINLSQSKFNKELFFSKRFSAKESFVKAMSLKNLTKFSFKEIEILSDQSGKPFIDLNGKVKKIIEEEEQILNCKFEFFVSLSDEPPNVLSFVIISLAP